MGDVAIEREEKIRTDGQWEAYHGRDAPTTRQLRYAEQLGKRLGVCIKTESIKDKRHASRVIRVLELGVAREARRRSF